MEYIFILGFIVVLVFFWKFLNRTAKATPQRTAPQKSSGLSSLSLELPQNLYYHQGHSWMKPDKPDIATIGVDDFLQNLIGRVNVIDLPRIGAFLRQGEGGWKLGGDTSTINVLAPLSGEVLEVNERVLSNPQVVNLDPYGVGWLLKVRVPKMKSDMANLLSGQLASIWMKETTDTFYRKISGNGGIAGKNGRSAFKEISYKIPPEQWNELVREFLLCK